MSNAEPRRDSYSGLWKQGPPFLVHDVKGAMKCFETVHVSGSPKAKFVLVS